MTFATYYDSTDTGLGGPANTAGALITFLDKVLVNGYNAQTLTSLTAVGTLVTATLNSHGFRDRQFVTISGATPSQYNGSWQIIVGSTTANTFQFNVAVAPGGAATGTLACIVTPLGYAKSFTGTNLAAYKQPAGNGFYLRVDDTGTTTAAVRGFETMSDVNTGTNPFPTVAQAATGLICSKSSGVARRCIAWGNGSLFYFFTDYTGDSSSGCLFAFGDGTPYKTGDVYFSVLIAQVAAGDALGSSVVAPYNSTANAYQGYSGQSSKYAARPFTAIAGAQTVTMITDTRFGNGTAGQTTNLVQPGSSGASNLAYPSPVDGNMWIAPPVINDNSGPGPRGQLPGMHFPMHNRPLGTYAIYQGAGSLAGKELMPINLGSTGQIHAEITNTW